VRQALEAQFYGRAGVQTALPGVREAVAAGQLTPWVAAGQLLGAL
jgi:LAO/AO transport system kinase